MNFMNSHQKRNTVVIPVEKKKTFNIERPEKKRHQKTLKSFHRIIGIVLQGIIKKGLVLLSFDYEF